MGTNTPTPQAAGETFANFLLLALSRDNMPPRLAYEVGSAFRQFDELASLLKFIQEEDGHHDQLEAARQCLYAAAEVLAIEGERLETAPTC